MTDERLKSITILNIESDITNSVEYNEWRRLCRWEIQIYIKLQFFINFLLSL